MSKLPILSVTLQPDQLSDLFFNYDHPHRDKLYAEDVARAWDFPERERAAVYEDAKAFVATLTLGTDNLYLVLYSEPEEFDLAAALADDFMRRR